MNTDKQTVDTVELVDEESPLHLAVAQSGLELESARSLETAFAPMFKSFEEWRIKVEKPRASSAG